ncbi:acyl-CoA thioesterase [Aspergillus saccharolyticus JOP 1030-1]|uniref:Peroxisomal acyl-coenzyme a thioester hydrolase n=1 Tax=Aspergillus saccharolyticus JOP 1030-1 TaxID=1450539 RepID=A0A318ZQW9_9EURO|nr:peroxisomal acyl-coenzyme a thioester hydrolase [Aspergillus saccharolyticus JOP 1030-1]PYH46350.1 peroxisomal acyl-coenzyme a thioester hydrolase [Aspergillus saccharolyticus JOP 1030-1]
MLKLSYTESPSSFAELMSLRRLNSPPADRSSSSAERIELFQSLAPPYPPGEADRAFGGHVYAQSAYAASQTVEKGFLIHDITGTFILPGRLDIPYEYSVRHLRDGRSYSTRAIDARQAGQICFSAVCSFKRPEEAAATASAFAHQPAPVQERYAALLAGKHPQDFEVSPGVDADFYIDYWREQWKKHGIAEREFPGLEARKVDMQGYNQTEEVRRCPDRYRQLTYYKLKGSPGDSCPGMGVKEVRRREREGEFDNLYACAHMYAADKNSLLLIPRALGIKAWNALASLTLTIVFHDLGKGLRMVDWDADSTEGVEGEDRLPKKWFVQEGWTPRSGDNRAVHESWLWSPDGRLVATSYQDSMLKVSRVDREKL